jgi:hypothetical protein
VWEAYGSLSMSWLRSVVSCALRSTAGPIAYRILSRGDFIRDHGLRACLRRSLRHGVVMGGTSSLLAAEVLHVGVGRGEVRDGRCRPPVIGPSS